jgi:hypothetical protein
VRIPTNLWPRTTGYKTQVKLKRYDERVKGSQSLADDPYVTVLGTQAYELWPIYDEQDAPVPTVQ